MTLVLLRAGLAAALLLAASAAHAQSERSAGELTDAVMWGKEPIGGSFALIDHTGKPRTDAECWSISASAFVPTCVQPT
jgi:cytochrome oxidase Cu insertion factor (SCO1/SenC/PrrC family)